MNKIRWKSMDVLKGICCIAVLFIHFNFKGDAGLYVKTFCRFAVPTFLMISGFFFLSDGKSDDGKTVKKIRHIVKLIVGSSVFYAVYTYVINKITDPDWSWSAFASEKIKAGKFVKLIITNDPFVYSHLWYMLALVYCYIFVVFLFEKNKRLKAPLVLAPVLLVCYSCLQEFSGLHIFPVTVPIAGSEMVVCLFNLFIFRALPFFLFGIVFRQYYRKLSEIPLPFPVAVIIFIAGGVIAVIERQHFSESQFYIGTYIMVAMLFLTALKHPEKEIKLLGYIGRELSLYVYILHIAMGRITDLIIVELGIYSTNFYKWSRAFIILLMSLLAAQLVVLLKRLTATVKKEINTKFIKA